MAKRTAKELTDLLSKILPDSTTDDALSLMEDINDSVSSDGEDWKSKYDENDKAWRQRYRDRFMGNSNSEPDPEPDPEPEPEKKLTYDALFTAVK